MFTKTRFVTNTDLETSKIFIESGVALEVQYNNHIQLYNLVVDLLQKKESDNACSYIDFEILGYEFWDVKVDMVVKNILNNSKQLIMH